MGKIVFGLLILLLFCPCEFKKGTGQLNKDKQANGRQGLSVEEVSLEDGSSSSTLYGSTAGGTQLKITGEGFDQSLLEKNKVFLGTHACTVLSARKDFLTCETETIMDPDSESDSLNVEVVVGDQSTIAPNNFKYSSSSTPSIIDIFPSTFTSDTIITLWGVFKIGSVGDYKKNMGDDLLIKIGEIFCSRQGFGKQLLSTSYNRFLKCGLNNAIAGKYAIDLKVLKGFAKLKDLLNKKYRFDEGQENYHVKVLPSIKSVFPNIGGSQMLHIEGRGFPESDWNRIRVEVGGRNCQIKSVDLFEIICMLESEETEEFSMRIDTNSFQEQIKPFIGGSGWEQKKYSTSPSGTMEDIHNIVSQMSLPDVTPTKILELKQMSNLFSYRYFTISQGYFKAPKTGNFTFRAFASDKFALYIASEFGTAQINETATPAIWSDIKTGNTSHFNTNGNKIVSQPLFMEAGQYYFMELYHVKAYSSDYYTYNDYLQVDVQVPTEQGQFGDTWAVHTFTTAFDPLPEKILFVQQGAQSGTITLSLIRTNSNFQMTYNRTKTIPYNCSQSHFYSTIKTFSGYQEYPLEVKLTIYDEAGYDVTTNSSAIGYRFEWMVSIFRLRQSAHLKETLDYELNVIGAGIFDIEEVQSHSDLISGTFTLSYHGNDIYYESGGQKVYDLSYSITSSLLQLALRTSLPLFQNVKVEFQGEAEYGATWYIEYVDVPLSTPELQPTLLNANLEGGHTKPTIQYAEMRPFTNNTVYPVDEHFMFESAQLPHVHVTVDDELLSVCQGDCGYWYTSPMPETPEEAEDMRLRGDLIGGQLLVVENEPKPRDEPLDIDPANITVMEHGSQVECESVVFDPSAPFLECSFALNQYGLLPFQAGDLTMSVVVSDLQGAQNYIPIQYGNMFMPLTVLSIAPNHGPTNGGFLSVITGGGFPHNGQGIEVIICDQVATILQANNSIITIRVPGCPAPAPMLNEINITFNGETQTRDFEYRAADAGYQPIVISSLFPSSASPVKKQTINITGEGFGNDSSTLEIVLKNSIKQYPVKILQITEDEIIGGLSGGIAGQYTLQIYHNQRGMSRPLVSGDNIFKYELVIESITPTIGSIYGGTILNITGLNFSPDEQENLVFIGNRMNTFCQLLEYSQTKLTCITPPMPDSYSPEQAYLIDVTSSITEQATCQDPQQCMFTFVEVDGMPFIEDINQQHFQNYSTPVSLYGNFSNLTQYQYQLYLINVDTLEQIQVPSYTFIVSMIVFDIPQIQSGTYRACLRNELGDSNSVTFTLSAAFNNQTVKVTRHGGMIMVEGTGLPNKWPHELFSASLSNTDEFKVLESTPTMMTIQIEPIQQTSKSFRLQLRGPLGQTSAYISQQQLYTRTPSMVAISHNEDIYFNISKPFSSSHITYAKFISLSNRQLVRVTSNINDTGMIQVQEELRAGGWEVAVHDNCPEGQGWHFTSSSAQIDHYGLNYTDMEFGLGGGLFGVAGAVSQGAIIVVDDQSAYPAFRRDGTTWFQIPPLDSEEDADIYSLEGSTESRNKNFLKLLKRRNIAFKYVSDQNDDPIQAAKAFDTKRRDRYSSPNSVCYVGYQIEAENYYMQLKKVVIALPKKKDKSIIPKMFNGARIEATIDGENWITIREQDKFKNRKRYVFKTKKGHFDGQPYRFKGIRVVLEDSPSQCQFNRLKFKGRLFRVEEQIANFPESAIFYDGASIENLTASIRYNEDLTPKVYSLDKVTGDVLGGYELTLNGTNLGPAVATVLIDGIECQLLQNNQTTIKCLVGEKPDGIEDISFNVVVGNQTAIIYQQFYYVMRWSDDKTWGVDFLPNDGDFIHVPAGQTLHVDQSTPDLLGILVEGRIIFTDETDMIIRTGFIMLRDAVLWAGDASKPYQHRLTFELTGSYYSRQTPFYGNKFISCDGCYMSMYGKEVGKSWSTLEYTAQAGDYNITLTDGLEDIFWQQGSQVVIASTSYNPQQAQIRQILSIDEENITLDEELEFTHLGRTIDGHFVDGEIQAEVSTLARNIQIKGVNNTKYEEYGGKVIIHGDTDETYVSIQNVQFTQCGQPQLPQQACIVLSTDGDASQSVIGNNVFHHTYSRGIQINDGHEWNITSNVFYQVAGHNINLDGVFSMVNVEHNLVINPRRTWKLDQTDMYTAGIHTKSPMNNIYGNHLAGGSHYGIWYDLNTASKGGDNECAWGMPFGQHYQNTIHSFEVYGVFISKISSRSESCGTLYTDGRTNTIDSYQSSISHNTIYHIGDTGLYIENSGHVLIENTFFLGNRIAADFYSDALSPYTSKMKNCSFFARLQHDDPNTSQIMLGLPCSNGFIADGVEFAQAGSNVTAVRTCDTVNLRTVTDEYKMNNIVYSNFTGKYVNFVSQLDGKELIYSDGSFTNSSSPTTVVTYYPHLYEDDACYVDSEWPSAIICNDSVEITKIRMEWSYNYKFIYTSLKIKKMDNFSSGDASPSSLSSHLGYYYSRAHEIPFIEGRYYNFWWGSSIQFDFSTITFTPNSNYQILSSPIILAHHYAGTRQLYQVRVGSPLVPAKQLGQELQIGSCQFGEFYHSTHNKIFGLCLSPDDWQAGKYAQAVGIYCRYFCPKPPEPAYGCDTGAAKQQHLWSDPSIWPDGVVPQEGDSVTVERQWNLILNDSPPPLKHLRIEGTLVILDERNITIEAQSIWVRGSLIAGQTNPFSHHLTFIINDGHQLKIDGAEKGENLFAVTGSVYLRGQAPNTIWTHLMETVTPNSTILKVKKADDWAVGDKLVISSSFTNYNQTEYVTITNIIGTTILIQPPLAFTHYGASSETIDNSWGKIDLRAAVGHLNRKIKIEAGGESNGWRLLTYGYSECNKPKFGRIDLTGVELVNGGQARPNYPAMHFKRINQNIGASSITSSSIHHCWGQCVEIENSQNIKFNNNVFAEANNFHFLLLDDANIKISITYNLLVDVHGSERNLENVACVEWKESVTDTEQDSLIYENLCIGSQGAGFSANYLQCDEGDQSVWVNNTVGSADVGFAFHPSSRARSCVLAQGARVYGARLGVAGLPKNIQTVVYKKLLIVDSISGVALKLTSRKNNLKAVLENSYISAIERPTCSQCYGTSNNNCHNTAALIMFTATQNLPLYSPYDSGISEAMSMSVLDCSAFLRNVVFKNFNQRYGEAQLSSCRGNTVFRAPTSADQLIASHHLYNTTCENCTVEGTIYFHEPEFAGENAVCGEIACTGKNNYYIQDHDGHFFGSIASLVPNTSFADDSCMQINNTNGLLCNGEEFIVLEFQSIAQDYNSRKTWPITILSIDQYEEFFDQQTESFHQGEEQVINGFKEWNFDRKGKAKGTRYSRFISLLEKNQIYYLNFSSKPPQNMELRLQKKEYESDVPEDWAILKIYYPVSNSIRVMVGRQVIDPITILDQHTEDPLLNYTEICGANKFYFKDQTIDFVITGEEDCVPRLTITNSIQLTAKFDMSLEDFYGMDGRTKFIDRMAALLGIEDRSRIKIVGIYRGSVEVNSFVDEQPPDANITEEERAEEMSEMNERINEMVGSGEIHEQFREEGFGDVIFFKNDLHLVEEDIQDNSDHHDDQVITEEQINILLIAGIAAGILVLLGIVACLCYCKRKNQVDNQLYEEEKSEQKRIAKKRTMADSFSIVQLD